MIKLNKMIMLVGLLLVLPIVNAYEECTNPIDPANVPCNIISTYPFNCTAENIVIYNDKITIIDRRGWKPYVTGLCNTTWNYTKGGTYYLNSSEGSNMFIHVDIKNSEYYLFIIAFVVIAILLILGFKTNDPVFHTIGGMLMMGIALDIFLNGFPNLANDYLKNGLVIVLTGIGMIFAVGPYLERIEQQ